jgi:hypothetical protein
MWWANEWVSQNMAVPILPVVTYRARMLLTKNRATSDYAFWWRVFEAEWTVLLFSCWCADIPQRGLMWRLPELARRNLDTLGIEEILLRSSYCVSKVRAWISAHDTHNWKNRRMRCRIRGPSRGLSELTEERTELVRAYHLPSERTHTGQNSSRAMVEKDCDIPNALPNIPRVGPSTFVRTAPHRSTVSGMPATPALPTLDKAVQPTTGAGVIAVYEPPA